jgi:glucokinase
MNWLAADIGGTYSRLAWHDDDRPAEPPLVVENARFTTFESVLDQALAHFDAAGQRIDSMTLALPGPVHDEPVQLTNIDWRVSRRSLQERFAVKQLSIVNDFQAAALGAILEPPEQLKTLNPGIPGSGPAVVAGAGTGLGMAWFARNDPDTVPHATEGGHVDFAPQDAEQQRLHDSLTARFRHVSYERILSGSGLIDVYRHLARSELPALTAADVGAAAKRGEATALAAVQLFVDVFAAYAGNLALSFNPAGGIYLCGGLAIHLADWFEPAGFQARFLAKGRMRQIVERIPVFLVTRHNTGLAGAMRLARQTTGQKDDQQ